MLASVQLIVQFLRMLNKRWLIVDRVINFQQFGLIIHMIRIGFNRTLQHFFSLIIEIVIEVDIRLFNNGIVFFNTDQLACLCFSVSLFGGFRQIRSNRRIYNIFWRFNLLVGWQLLRLNAGFVIFSRNRSHILIRFVCHDLFKRRFWFLLTTEQPLNSLHERWIFFHVAIKIIRHGGIIA